VELAKLTAPYRATQRHSFPWGRTMQAAAEVCEGRPRSRKARHPALTRALPLETFPSTVNCLLEGISSMPTIAIVGAGPGLGRSIAK
jgi:hypothetical protein